MENNDIGSVDLEELEVSEIDVALLRDLLEEEYEFDDGGVKQLMEEDKDKNIMIDKEEKEQNDCHVHDFEWLKMMDMEMETGPPNDEILDWYPDDIVGMVDFGYDICEYGYSQGCDVIISNEASNGCLWESL